MAKQKPTKGSSKKSDQPDKKKPAELTDKDLDRAVGGQWGVDRGVDAIGSLPRKGSQET
jgi:hypothetical protein